ncbi:hypothetical protein VKT23_015486 [Stygiomarasmius scandens]|uniref:DUF6533 domain-containing protein n=1 Tax=Marasmiellus scandens TaxID=2682957 RepID=A0ABR1J114_9AGAR
MSSFTESSVATSIIPFLEAEQMALYILTSSVVIIVWDILTNFADECEMILQSKFNAPTGIYVLSRVSSVSFIWSTFVFFSTPDPKVDCMTSNMLSTSLLAISTNSHAFLFLLRARAIFHDIPKIQRAFTVLWTIVLLCSASLDLVFADAKKVSDSVSEHCTYGDFHPAYAIASITVGLVFDTAVYLSISFRLFRLFRLEDYNQGAKEAHPTGLPTLHQPQESTRVFLFGRADLPVFSRSLFQDGQFYYMMSWFITVASIAIISAPFSLFQYNLICVPFYSVFMNVIACYVFRNVKLGRIRERTISTDAVESQIRFQCVTSDNQLQAAAFGSSRSAV